jgi:hypothetical protein
MNVPEPGSIVQWVRGRLLRLWLTKGGGFYGLGYVITFIVLEARALTSDIAASDSVIGFVESQAIQYIIRISFQSIVNGVLAIVWPIYLLNWLGGFGILVLVGGYLAFVHGARPLVETWFPEIGEAREAKAAKKLARRENKRARRASKAPGSEQEPLS